ncbi:hypothetical protein [Mycobacterium basiliense]|uniref:hypothetical protein n=1 Tax=Mycobacterium basiliense TaxID=2094119 RepID=UPI001E31C20A|nr:hypothetical protein [Mycobacterium basiliense]
MDPEPAAIAQDFIWAFSAADFPAMRRLLAADLVAHVTNAEGGTDEINEDEYLRRIEAIGRHQSGLGDG